MRKHSEMMVTKTLLEGFKDFEDGLIDEKHPVFGLVSIEMYEEMYWPFAPYSASHTESAETAATSYKMKLIVTP